MSNSVAGAWWTFEIVFNPSNGSGAFEINRFYTYTRGAAPYYLLYRSRAVLVNDGSYSAALYILPAWTTNAMITPFYIPISTFNTFTEWVNNTDTNFQSYALHTYGQYIFPNGKFVSYRRWTTTDKGQNFKVGWASYSPCNDQYTSWNGGCYSSITTSERPYILCDLFNEMESE